MFRRIEAVKGYIRRDFYFMTKAPDYGFTTAVGRFFIAVFPRKADLFARPTRLQTDKLARPQWALRGKEKL